MTGPGGDNCNWVTRSISTPPVLLKFKEICNIHIKGDSPLYM